MESIHNSLTAVSHNYDAILINLTIFPAKSIVKQLFKYKCQRLFCFVFFKIGFVLLILLL